MHQLYQECFVFSHCAAPAVLWRTDSGSKFSKLDKLPTFVFLPNKQNNKDNNKGAAVSFQSQVTDDCIFIKNKGQSKLISWFNVSPSHAQVIFLYIKEYVADKGAVNSNTCLFTSVLSIGNIIMNLVFLLSLY